MKRLYAPAFNYTDGLFHYLGMFNCECIGEWSNKVKSWVDPEHPSLQFSCCKVKNGKKIRGKSYYFILECVN